MSKTPPSSDLHHASSSRLFRMVIVGLCYFVCFTHVNDSVAEDNSQILYINSYHPGYKWSDRITVGIESRLLVEDTRLQIHYMDTLRKRQPDQLKRAVVDAVKAIEDFQPEIIITSDDIAAKYVINHLGKGSPLPVVFSGVNGEASDYGTGKNNVTGILEVSLTKSLVDLLEHHALGNRLGFLSLDTLTGRKNLDNYSNSLTRKINRAYFVNSYEEWKTQFSKLQTEVDMMILGDPTGVPGWDEHDAIGYTQETMRIPVGSFYDWLAPFSVITIALVPEEQGWWAAEAAIKILNGKKPSEIPISKNVEGKLLINLKLAEKIGVTLSPALLETAEIVDR